MTLCKYEMVSIVLNSRRKFPRVWVYRHLDRKGQKKDSEINRFALMCIEVTKVWWGKGFSLAQVNRNSIFDSRVLTCNLRSGFIFVLMVNDSRGANMKRATWGDANIGPDRSLPAGIRGPAGWLSFRRRSFIPGERYLLPFIDVWFDPGTTENKFALGQNNSLKKSFFIPKRLFTLNFGHVSPRCWRDQDE